jgi:hypothetical protein
MSVWCRQIGNDQYLPGEEFAARIASSLHTARLLVLSHAIPIVESAFTHMIRLENVVAA